MTSVLKTFPYCCKA